MSARARRLAVAALWTPLAACQGPGVPTPELPTEPIAVAYLDAEQARRRADALAAKDPKTRAERQQQRRGRAGVVPVDEVQGFLEGLAGGGSRPRRLEHAGRLALLTPRTGEVTLIPAARRGARPQAWSPDRRRLLFSQPDSNGVQLYEYDLEQDEVRTLTRGPHWHPRGCYGPDGRLVLMKAGVEGGRAVTRVALTNAGGIDPQPISSGPYDHSPTCAPDGSAVVYVSTSARGRHELVAVSPVATGTPRPIGPGRAPAFSADGQWVVFSAQVGGQWQLWRIRADGSGRARVGKGVLDETDPAVSPDARLVVYVVEEAHRKRLYLRRIDGSGDRILFRDGDAEDPVW